eukprot:TRINITY_DN8698_c0_g1_i1.p1 TRINITY_DN8698_c0_g1~~TRINITY_DN8698_c0_g1_i1.p1  ORF type:complete len:251 (+),score=61.95 TRINITY_DN8698_c0_g1_i1:89-841(+)
MAEDQVLVSVDSGIAVVEINRPRKLGALTKKVFTSLLDTLPKLGKDRAVSCVVLCSRGRAFSAGNEILGDVPPDWIARAAIAAIEDCQVPVIAAVQGFAYTGALEVLLAADLIVAGESTYFQDTHSKLGLVPTWGGNVRMPGRIGIHRAKEMVFTCRRVTAREAESWGLVNKVVPDDQVFAAAHELAKQITANSRESIVKQKRVINTSWAQSRLTALPWIERFHQGHAADASERLRAISHTAKGSKKSKM